MNAVEIEEAVSELAAQPFDAAEFPFAFLRAFGRKDVELQRLRKGNASDVPGGVLRRDSIHMATCRPGGTDAALAALRESPKTSANRVKFIVATDGLDVQAEECATGEIAAFPLPELGRHFGFFLPLAGISSVKAIKDNPIDVKAVGRLNKLYLELLRENPDWAGEAKRPELNRLMARLVFCFFAEDTGIFRANLFTGTLQQLSDGTAARTNTDEVLRQLFLAMATPALHQGKPDGRHRQAAGVKPYADPFPYVNGGLFADAGQVPRFSRAARNYLLRAGELDWREINPDIFGSMIQAVAEDDERASLGMHYTSVPNILKVLNPLFLDELREKLDEAGDSIRKLRALRRRIGRIRVFDPACGSGNFLVVAYRMMRDIEHEIVERTGDEPKSVIPLTNFYGIEIKGFAAEIARLALLIAEFQADARLISQMAAQSMVLPLHRSGQIHTGNAMRLDWLQVCPPAAPVVEECDLGGPTGRLGLEDSSSSGISDVETYVCGNPPYVGSKWQSAPQRADVAEVLSRHVTGYKTLDYVCGWIWKAAGFIALQEGAAAFVATNSVCQGEQVANLWPPIFSKDIHITFAHRSFKWQNLAAHNAGVIVIIVGISRRRGSAVLFDQDVARRVPTISPYLIAGDEVVVEKRREPLTERAIMRFGNHPYYATDLMLTCQSARVLRAQEPGAEKFLRPLYGAQEFIDCAPRTCIWVSDAEAETAWRLPQLASLFSKVRAKRLAALNDVAAQLLAKSPYRFRDQVVSQSGTLIVPRVTSERREYLPVGLLEARAIVQDQAFALNDAPLWNLALIASRAHVVWVGAVCGKMKNDYRYSNTLGWNTFPVPPLTEEDKADLTRCAEGILLVREAHFPATIADMYDPERMDTDFPDVRAAHERNDETLERIYIGRRFRNDTERLEHLFALYIKLTASESPPGERGAKKPRAKRSEKAA